MSRGPTAPVHPLGELYVLKRRQKYIVAFPREQAQNDKGRDSASRFSRIGEGGLGLQLFDSRRQNPLVFQAEITGCGRLCDQEAIARAEIERVQRRAFQVD